MTVKGAFLKIEKTLFNLIFLAITDISDNFFCSIQSQMLNRKLKEAYFDTGSLNCFRYVVVRMLFYLPFRITSDVFSKFNPGKQGSELYEHHLGQVNLKEEPFPRSEVRVILPPF